MSGMTSEMVGRGCGQELYERKGVVQGETGEEDRLRQSLLRDAADNEPYPKSHGGLPKCFK